MDGWLVKTLLTERVEGWSGGVVVAQVKEQIRECYQAAPANDKPKVLFLLGHIPVARSGLDAQPFDGHAYNRGAQGADTYYADLNGEWTDTGTSKPVLREQKHHEWMLEQNTLPRSYPQDRSFHSSRHDYDQINIPGDYKWDQDFLSGGLTMAFGRVDFADCYDVALPEELMMIRYLDKDHAYRHNLPGYQMGNKVAFGHTDPFKSTLDMSLRNLIPIAGSSNILSSTNIGDGSIEGPGQNAWVKEHGPFMIYLQNRYYPNLPEWESAGMDAMVYGTLQSLVGWWAMSNCALREVLAFPKTLISLWSIAPMSMFYPAGLGEPMGLCIRRAMEHTAQNNIYERPLLGWEDGPNKWGRTAVAFLGDPTLRLFQVTPATNAAVSRSGNTAVIIWMPSTETSLAGYHIYRSDCHFGAYTKLTGNKPITDTTFTDRNPINHAWYMIRAVKLQTTGSGTFLNPSQGIFCHIDDTVSTKP